MYALKVPVDETEDAIELAKSKGVYDETRSVLKHNNSERIEFTEVPVTAPIEEYKTVEQTDPKYRKDSLERITGLDNVPSGWSIVGNVILVKFGDRPQDEKERIGEGLLKLHSNCHTVLEDKGVKGIRREPDVEVIAGKGETETLHTENNFKFKLDLREVMFSVGNSRERVYMHENVKEGERVFDMFAGIGYFSVPIAKGGGEVTAAEINPISYDYLLENARLNAVEVNAYNDDCRNVEVGADRVVMGHFDSLAFLDHALNCLDGGWIHLHDAVHENEINKLEKEVRGKTRGKGREVISTRTRRIKSYSEGVWHVVVDAEIV